MEALQKLSASIGLLILRLGAGGFMATHGWGKMKMLMDGQSAQFGSHLGMSPGMSLFLAVVGEFFCALLVMAGLATRLAAIPTVITMFVAAFVAHGGDPWTMEAAAKRPATPRQGLTPETRAKMFSRAAVRRRRAGEQDRAREP